MCLTAGNGLRSLWTAVHHLHGCQGRVLVEVFTYDKTAKDGNCLRNTCIASSLSSCRRLSSQYRQFLDQLHIRRQALVSASAILTAARALHLPNLTSSDLIMMSDDVKKPLMHVNPFQIDTIYYILSHHYRVSLFLTP